MDIIALILIPTAYLLGSISSAIIICAILTLPDPREVGSQNPGATNVLRLGGKKAAIAVLICDVLKGMLPVWGGYYLGLGPVMLGVVAISACLGHMYPVFFQFNGGKGVATALGAIAPIGLDLTCMVIATWLISVLVSRYSSVAAIVTVVLTPFYTWLIKPSYTLPVSMLCCLIIFTITEILNACGMAPNPVLGNETKQAFNYYFFTNVSENVSTYR